MVQTTPVSPKPVSPTECEEKFCVEALDVMKLFEIWLRRIPSLDVGSSAGSIARMRKSVLEERLTAFHGQNSIMLVVQIMSSQEITRSG